MNCFGPGPAKYLLPPTVGYNQHDATRNRRPAYTMARRVAGPGAGTIGPGAAKYDTNNQTNVGAPHVSAYIGRQFRGVDASGIGPGPIKYKLPSLIGRDRMRIWLPDSPDFTMGQRLNGADARTIGPGPASYLLGSPSHSPQYTMAGMLKKFGDSVGPGPAKYNTRSGYKNAGITMAGRLTGRMGSISPAANTYNLADYKPGKRRPLYSMGRRTERNPMILPGDNCY